MTGLPAIAAALILSATMPAAAGDVGFDQGIDASAAKVTLARTPADGEIVREDFFRR